MSRSILKPVRKTIRTTVGYTDNGVKVGGDRSLPSFGLLQHVPVPNSGSNFLLGTQCYDAVGGVGIFFSGPSTPIAATPASIVSDGIGSDLYGWNVIYSAAKGLTVYGLTTPVEIINKARLYHGYSQIYPKLAWGIGYQSGLSSLYGPQPAFASAGVTPKGDGTTYAANVLPVDATGKGVYVGPGYQNLFTTAPTGAAALTLTAQKYCLQCFDTGDVTCSYGTATPGTPLIFTATAGSTTFTPTSCGGWQLTASGGYVFPRLAHNTTVTSCAGTSGNNGLGWAMDTGMLEALRGRTDGTEIWNNASASGTNWALATGAWTHTAGSTTVLSIASVLTLTARYLVTYTVTRRTAGSVTARAGSSGTGGTANTTNATFTEELTCAGSTDMQFVPTTDFNGTVTVTRVQRLLPSRTTAAALVTMGVGSGELGLGTTMGVLSQAGAVDGVGVLYSRRNGDGTVVIVRAYDGTSTEGYIISAWSRNETHLKIVQTNRAGTQFRVGNRRLGIDSSVQWSSWATYDGSFNPLTYLRAAYNGTVPLHLKSTQFWDRPIADAEIYRWATEVLV